MDHMLDFSQLTAGSIRQLQSVSCPAVNLCHVNHHFQSLFVSCSYRLEVEDVDNVSGGYKLKKKSQRQTLSYHKLWVICCSILVSFFLNVRAAGYQ